MLCYAKNMNFVDVMT